MFLSFLGFSLLFHLTVIGLAALSNKLKGNAHLSAFQTHGKHGGWFKSKIMNTIASYAIVIVLATYVFTVFGFSVYLGFQYGADEPQIIALKWAVGLFFTAMSSVVFNETFFVPVGVGLAALITFVLYNPLKSRLFAPAIQYVSGTTAALLAFIGVSRLLMVVVLGGTLLAIPAVAGAQIVEPGFESEVIAGGFSLPTATAFAADGRIFVAEKNGVVKVVKNGAVLPTPVITLTDINTFGDRGLIGMTLDPNFSSNGYLYLSYSYENTPGLNPSGPKTGRIVRVTVIGDVASESSKFVLVGTVGGDATNMSCEDFAVTADCIASDSNSHSVGALKFGPDGKLYASLGDGADFAAIDPRAFRAQDIDSLAGKVLRINTDGTAPTDNPFFDGDVNSNRSKVYAYGFRNMFRLSFNETTGRLYGGDVGWSDWEEVNEINPGNNYGWPCREGANNSPYNCTNPTADTDPIYDYPHNASGAGSIIVGSFGTNDAYPDQYDSSLFIGDYAQQWIKRMVLNADGSVASVEDFQSDFVFPVEFNTGADGNVHYIDIAFGSLNRLTHTDGNRRPVVSASADVTSGLSPLTVQFDSTGTFDPDADAVDFLWDFDDGVTANIANPTHTYNVNGVYTAALTVTDSFGASASESIDVTVGNQKPAASIISPTSGSLYFPLENVTVNGDAIDPEDGNLPASAFDWTVILHHNVHTHTVQQFSDTKQITFVADDHNDSDVYMEIELTVTDANGLTDTTSINMYLNNGGGTGNLINNPSMEIGDPIIPSQPLNWIPGWFGSMTPTFTYPVIGLSGNTAAELTVADYSAGAARWYFAPVFVVPGNTYEFSHLYTANVNTELTIQYARPDGSYLYQSLGLLPPAADPTTTNYDIVVPEGMQSMTVFHDLAQNGTVKVDEYSLSLKEIVVEPEPNLVFNGDFELVNGDGTPQNWTPSGWGTHTRNHVFPVPGRNGGNAAQVVITEYEVTDSGDSKWAHTPIPVTPGTEYNFSTYYKSDTISDVIAQYTMTDGSFFYQGIGKEILQATDWTLEEGSFIAPENAVTMTPFHLISAVGTLTIDDVVITASSTGNQSETNPPVVNIVSHTDGETVSGTVTFEATATDETEVVGVFFALNGNAIGVEDATAPYEVVVDTTDFVNGTNVLKATSYDPFGNNDAVEISIVIDNQVVVPGDNLVNNGGFEVLDAAGDPVGWREGGYGINDNNYNVFQDTTGNNVGYVEIFNYTSGDAKWVFDDVAVTAGETYRFSVDYSSKNSNEVVAFYTLADGTTQAELLGYSPAYDTNSPNDLTSYEVDFVAVENAATVTVFHTPLVVDVTQPSYGYIDNVSLVQVTGDPVDPPTGDNLIANGDLEAGSANNPTNWAQGGWGTNDRVFTYPVAGQNGDAARVEMISYTSGDGKWFFAPVAITPNEVYEFTNFYRSDVTTETVVAYTLTDGTFQYEFIDSKAPVATWTENTFQFTAPANATAATIFHNLAAVGFLEIDNVSLVGDAGTPVDDDNVAPDVAIANIGNGQTLSGAFEVRLDAEDASGITETTLSIVGTSLFYTDTTAPYAFAVDVTSLANGTYTLRAEAIDASANANAAADQLTIVVENDTGTTTDPVDPPTGDNLIVNGDIEAGVGTPNGWFQGGWGDNTANFIYPVDGQGGDVARIEMTAYNSGDAKWYFAPVAVVSGDAYSYSHQYRSDVATEVVAQYTMTDGTFQYGFLDSLAPAAAWTTNNGTFTTPTNTESVTIFHNLTAVGFLEIDNWVLTGTTGTTTTSNDTQAPVVTLTNLSDGETRGGVLNIDATVTDNVGVDQTRLLVNGAVTDTDGVAPYDFVLDTTELTNGPHQLIVEAEDEAGNIGQSTEITLIVDNGTTTPPTGGNLIVNGDLEAGSANNPTNWLQGGWGVNDAVFTYPVAGPDGSDAARVEFTDYTSGDAKWYFGDVNVTASTSYTFTIGHQNDVAADVVVRYTMNDGSFVYDTLGQLAVSAGWNETSYIFITPEDVVTVTIFNNLAAVGFLEIDNAQLVAN